MLVLAIVFITGALVFYSFGVWGEKLSGRLSTKHLVLFWIGLVCDTTGTTLMGAISGGGFQFDFHGITGMLAILLMLVHAVWATIVLARKDEKASKSFHSFSVAVWGIWLVPYFSGVLVGAGIL